MIRRAVEGDIPRLVDMGRKFAGQNYPDDGFDEDDFAKVLRDLVADESGIVLVSNAGMIGAVVFPLYFNNAKTIAQELFWWDEGHEGRDLLLRFEYEARNMGAGKIVVSSPTQIRGKAVDRLYSSAGYVSSEHFWTKEL